MTPRDPCPVCGHGGWCRVRDDGNFVVCRRVAAGCHQARRDKNGAEYYLHRIGGARRESRPADALPRPAGPAPERADPDTLDRTYNALLGRLSLTRAHREDLRRRGLPDEAIDRNLYRTLPADKRERWRVAAELLGRLGGELLDVPGFVARQGRHGGYATIAGFPGLLIPVRDLAGRIQALKVRRDVVAEGEDRYAALSGAGGPSCGSPPHAPLGTPPAAGLARVVEGELKADVLARLDPSRVPTLSAPGATNWRPVLPMIEALGAGTVRLCFDADAREKPAVARALRLFAEEIRARSLTLELEMW